MTRVYKIIERQDWLKAQAAGVFRGAEIDLRDGYIHLSTAGQTGETARLHFQGRTDLILLAIDAGRLGPELKWERSRRGALFPHLYGSIASDAVLDATPLNLNAEGWPDPGDLPA